MAACKNMDVGYRHACASASPDEFISRISHVAQHANKTRASLVMLTQLGYVSIDAARDPILEARGLANIFVASRTTAKRRQRDRVGSRKTPLTRFT